MRCSASPTRTLFVARDDHPDIVPARGARVNQRLRAHRLDQFGQRVDRVRRSACGDNGEARGRTADRHPPWCEACNRGIDSEVDIVPALEDERFRRLPCRSLRTPPPSGSSAACR